MRSIHKSGPPPPSSLGLKVQFTPKQLDSTGNWKETLDEKKYITRDTKQRKFIMF